MSIQIARFRKILAYHNEEYLGCSRCEQPETYILEVYTGKFKNFTFLLCDECMNTFVVDFQAKEVPPTINFN